MKKHVGKRALSLLLAVVLIVGCLPLSASAYVRKDWDVIVESTNPQDIKDWGYDIHGYENHWWESYWGAVAGNCTNYCAYIFTQKGITGVYFNNGATWADHARELNYPVDNNATVGSVAQWNAYVPYVGEGGHVAYVEEVNNDYIVVSEDNGGKEFRWRRIWRGSIAWPNNFIHFSDSQPPHYCTSYGSNGNCTVCGKYAGYTDKKTGAGIYYTQDGTKEYARPYSGSTAKKTHALNDAVAVSTTVANVNGQIWYKLKNGNFMKELALKEKPESRITIQMHRCPDGNILEDTDFPLVGTVDSQFYSLTNVSGYFLNTGTKEKSHNVSVKPNGRHYAIQNDTMAKALQVKSLEPGAYELYISAADTEGITKTWKQAFTVLRDKDKLDAPKTSVADVPTGKRVTLSVPEPGAVIYYTTDGSQPTKKSSKYSTPLMLNRTTTIRAFAAKSGKKDSRELNQTVQIQQLRTPTITVEKRPEDALITITGSSGASTSYKLNGGAPKKYSGPFQITRTMTVEAYSTQKGYGQSETVKMKVELTAPDKPVAERAVAAKVAQGSNGGIAWETATNAGSYSVETSLNGEVLETKEEISGGSFSYPLEQAGTYSFRVKASNKFGDSPWSEPVSVQSMAPVTVTFTANGEPISVQSVPYGGSAVRPNAPAKRGYTFQGWSGSYRNVTEDVAIEAEYEINTYTIVFKNAKSEEITEYRQKNVPFGTELSLPEGPDSGDEDYVFADWYLEEGELDATEDGKRLVAGNLTFIAVNELKNPDILAVLKNCFVEQASNPNTKFTATVQVENRTNAPMNARVVVALKSSEDKLLATGTQDVVLAGSVDGMGNENTSVTVTVSYNGKYGTAVNADVSILGMDEDGRTTGAIGETQTLAVDTEALWSAWSTTNPSLAAATGFTRAYVSVDNGATWAPASISGTSISADIPDTAQTFALKLHSANSSAEVTYTNQSRRPYLPERVTGADGVWEIKGLTAANYASGSGYSIAVKIEDGELNASYTVALNPRSIKTDTSVFAMRVKQGTSAVPQLGGTVIDNAFHTIAITVPYNTTTIEVAELTLADGAKMFDASNQEIRAGYQFPAVGKYDVSVRAGGVTAEYTLTFTKAVGINRLTVTNATEMKVFAEDTSSTVVVVLPYGYTAANAKAGVLTVTPEFALNYPTATLKADTDQTAGASHAALATLKTGETKVKIDSTKVSTTTYDAVNGKLANADRWASFQANCGADPAMKVVVQYIEGVERVYDVYFVEPSPSAKITGLAIGNDIDTTLLNGVEASSLKTAELQNAEGDIRIETRTEYRYRDKSTKSTTTKLSSPGEWTYTGRTATGKYTAWSGWSNTRVSPTSDRQVETRTISAKHKKVYYYKRWLYTGADGRTWNSYSEYWGSNYAGNGRWEYKVLDKPLTDVMEWVDGRPHYRGDTHGWWAGGASGTGPYTTDTGSQLISNAYTQYRYRTKVYNYNYEKWGAWSAWNDSPFVSYENRQQESRTLYRWRVENTENTDTAGLRETISGDLSAIGTNLEGKHAVVMVYHGRNTDPLQSQLEYVGTTEIQAGNAYSIEINTLREMTQDTGDFVVTLAVPGATSPIEIKRFAAPVSTYTVQFLDAQGQPLGEAQQVEHYRAAAAPADLPELEGYTFTGWDRDFSDVTEDMAISPEFKKNEYTVTYVDWQNQTMESRTFQYQDLFAGPLNEEKQEIFPTFVGMGFAGWSTDGTEAGILTEAAEITASQVVYAVWSPETFTVEFMDGAGEDAQVLSAQQVEYGKAAVLPDGEPTVETGREFLGWSTDVTWWNVTENMKVTPIIAYSETSATPVTNLPSGRYPGEQVLELQVPGESAGTELYYKVTTYAQRAEEMENAESGAERAKETGRAAETPQGTVEASPIDSGFALYEGPVTIPESSIVEAYTVTGGKNNSQKVDLYVEIAEGTGEEEFYDAIPLASTTVTAKPGDTVDFTVNLQENPGLMGFQFYVECDRDVFTVDYDAEQEAFDLEKGAVTQDGELLVNTLEDKGWQVFWWNPTAVDESGSLFTLKLKVAEGALAGDYPVKVSYLPRNTVTTGSLETAPGQVELQVHSPNTMQWGDVNGDGQKTLADVVKIARYIVSLETLTPEQQKAADVNHDGDVTSADVVLLARYVVGLTDTLGEEGVS